MKSDIIALSTVHEADWAVLAGRCEIWDLVVLYNVYLYVAYILYFRIVDKQKLGIWW